MDLQRVAVLMVAGAMFVAFTGCSDLKRSQRTIRYGKVLIGTSKSAAASWTNTKNENITVLSCTTYDDDAKDFLIDTNSWNNADKDLAFREIFKVDIVFTPNRVGEHKTKVRPLHNKGSGDKIKLYGTGVYLFGENGIGCSGGDSSEKAAIDFKEVVVGQAAPKPKTVDLINNTRNTIHIVKKWGKDNQGFSVVQPTFPFDLKAGESVTVQISFTPPREDTFKDGLYFKVDGGNGVGGVSVKGKGVLE